LAAYHYFLSTHQRRFYFVHAVKSQKRDGKAFAAKPKRRKGSDRLAINRHEKSQVANSPNKAPRKEALPDMLLSTTSFTPAVSSDKTLKAKKALQQNVFTSQKKQATASAHKKTGKTPGRKTLLSPELQRMSPVTNTKPPPVASSSSLSTTTSSSPVVAPEDDKDVATASSSPSCTPIDYKAVSWDEEEEPIDVKALDISVAAAIDIPESITSLRTEDSQQHQFASTEAKAFEQESQQRQFASTETTILSKTDFCGCDVSAALSEANGHSCGDSQSGADTLAAGMEWSLETHKTTKAVDTSKEAHKTSSTSSSMETPSGATTNAGHYHDELKTFASVVPQPPSRVSSIVSVEDYYLEAALHYDDISTAFEYSSPKPPGSGDEFAMSFEDAYVELLDMEWVSNGDFSPTWSSMFYTVAANQPVSADEVFLEGGGDFDGAAQGGMALPVPKALTYENMLAAKSPRVCFSAPHSDEDKMPSIENAAPIPDVCCPPLDDAPICLCSNTQFAHNNNDASMQFFSHVSNNNMQIEEV
jgi:hypothetical protein